MSRRTGTTEKPGTAMVLMWLSRLCAAFLVACAVLIAGFAPYSSSMLDVLRIAAILLLGAGAAWLFGLLMLRLKRP